MSDVRIRSQIALLAARLMYSREESEYFTAKRKAARQLGVEYRYHPGDLPSNAEIRDQIGALAMLYEGDRRQENLRDMRLEALRFMRLFDAFHPRLLGSVLTGPVRKGSDIDLDIFSNHLAAYLRVWFIRPRWIYPRDVQMSRGLWIHCSITHITLGLYLFLFVGTPVRKSRRQPPLSLAAFTFSLATHLLRPTIRLITARKKLSPPEYMTCLAHIKRDRLLRASPFISNQTKSRFKSLFIFPQLDIPKPRRLLAAL